MTRIFALERSFIEISGTLYEVLRTIDEKSNLDMDQIKSNLYADAVFKRDGKLYFMRAVEDAQIIEEESKEENIEQNTNTENESIPVTSTTED